MSYTSRQFLPRRRSTFEVQLTTEIFVCNFFFSLSWFLIFVIITRLQFQPTNRCTKSFCSGGSARVLLDSNAHKRRAWPRNHRSLWSKAKKAFILFLLSKECTVLVGTRRRCAHLGRVRECSSNYMYVCSSTFCDDDLADKHTRQMTIYYILAANSPSNTVLLPSGQIWFVFFTSHKAASRTITYCWISNFSKRSWGPLQNFAHWDILLSLKFSREEAITLAAINGNYLQIAAYLNLKNTATDFEWKKVIWLKWLQGIAK